MGIRFRISKSFEGIGKKWTLLLPVYQYLTERVTLYFDMIRNLVGRYYFYLPLRFHNSKPHEVQSYTRENFKSNACFNFITYYFWHLLMPQKEKRTYS